MTIPAFSKALNGVNINKMMWWASERGWVFNEQRDPEIRAGASPHMPATNI
jgi:hypothetical protein